MAPVTACLIRDIRDTQKGKAHEEPSPEHRVTEQCVLLDSRNASNGNQRNLAELEKEKVHANFLRDDGHDEFVGGSTQEECEEHCTIAR